MSKPAARKPTVSVSGFETSVPRTAIAAGLILLGIAWMIVFNLVARDAWLFNPAFGGKQPSTALPWMADLGKWNYLVAWGLIFIGLIMASHPRTPLGHGRGVVIGMLFCFLFGLVYIVVYYFLGNNITKVPVMRDLDQLNLIVGIGFMAAGFTYATKWE